MNTFKVIQKNGKIIARNVHMPSKPYPRMSKDRSKVIISAPDKFSAIVLFIHYHLT